MVATIKRRRIASPDLIDVNGLRPLAGVAEIFGVRIYDVGQGDAIAILGPDQNPVLYLDYGGRQGNPFNHTASDSVDQRMPIKGDRLLMISHWDEDHWCSASKGRQAKAAEWLVPRQITSPRAVKFSAEIARISCIPEAYVGQGYRFQAMNGDSVWWEKIAPAPDSFAREEDCNRTGVAMSVVKANGAGDRDSVILLPGDAPFDRVGHYWTHFSNGASLKGMVAFHHGAGTHWTNSTSHLLSQWSDPSDTPQIIFSCANPNAYDHPQKHRYAHIISGDRYEATSEARLAGRQYTDIEF